MTTLKFRAAKDGDAGLVCALVNGAYRGESSKRGWTTEADLLGGQRTDPDKVVEMVEAERSRLELAFDEAGRLVACVHLKAEPTGACYVGMLTVDPNRQAAGVGKILLERSETLAREWGCARMRMTVIEARAELIAYYERRGYARTGATEAFPEQDPRFGLPKVKDLRFIELVKPLA